jgi:hypothetical protein
MVIFHGYVKLPEDMCGLFTMNDAWPWLSNSEAVMKILELKADSVRLSVAARLFVSDTGIPKIR